MAEVSLSVSRTDRASTTRLINWSCNSKILAGAAVIALRPDVARGGGIGELHIDPDGVARTADVASEHVPDPQLPGDRADVLGLVLVRERRVPGDHRQP